MHQHCKCDAPNDVQRRQAPTPHQPSISWAGAEGRSGRGSLWKRQIDVSLDHRELQHRQEADRQLLESSAYSPAFLQPTHTPFNDAPPSVCGFVELQRAAFVVGQLILALRSHRLDAVSPQPLPHAPIAVAFVAGQAQRTLTRPTQRLGNRYAVHHFLDLRRFVREI